MRGALRAPAGTAGSGRGARAGRGSGSGTGDTVSTSTPFNVGFVSVNDRVVFESKTITLGNIVRSGSITSYTNTFYAAESSEIPEPMTFVLMGAGLVGIAALRRRKA